MFYAANLGYLVLTRMEDVAEVLRRSDDFAPEAWMEFADASTNTPYAIGRASDTGRLTTRNSPRLLLLTSNTAPPPSATGCARSRSG